MLQELLSWLPQHPGPGWGRAALASALVGLVLWAAGGRVSRSVFTLLGVAAGAWAGVRVRQWLSPEVEPMGLACAGALALGIAGYLLHTVWVGLTLGTLLGAAGALVAWKRLAGDASWSVPLLDPAAPAHVMLHELWASLPGSLPRVMPAVICGCFATGVLITVFWPKLGRVLAFSALGSVMLAAGTVIAMRIQRPPLLEYFPAESQTQAIALAVLVMIGAALQWSMFPRPGHPAPPAGPRDRADRAGADDDIPRRPARPRDVNDLATRPALARMKLTTEAPA